MQLLVTRGKSGGKMYQNEKFLKLKKIFMDLEHYFLAEFDMKLSRKNKAGES